MRRRIGICVCAAAVAAAVWTVIASRVFVWMGGLSYSFPSPWTTWWLYAGQTRIDGPTLLYLAASGIMAAVPFGLIVALTLMIVYRKNNQPALWGNNSFANHTDMSKGGVRTVKSPFADKRGK